MPSGTNWSNTIDRTFALSTAFTVAHIALGTSQVGLNLWVLDGRLAEAAALVYSIVLLALAIDPDRETTHTVAAMAGVAFWMGRMGAFLDLALGGQTTLWAAVNERALMVVIIVLWHIRAIRAAVVRSNYARLRGEEM